MKKRIKLTESILKNIIKESLYNILREDIDVSDNDVYDYYDDKAYGNWSATQKGLPVGYDDDNYDAEEFVKYSDRLNNNYGSPILRRAEIDASWNKFDDYNERERERMLNKAEDDPEGFANNNIYDDHNTVDYIDHIVNKKKKNY